MLERISNKNNSAFQYVGKDETTGYNMYIVPVKENHERKITNLDDGLFDDDVINELPECNLDEGQAQERNFENLTLKDFKEMDYAEIYFSLYQQIKFISSLLSDNTEVGKDASKL